MKKRLYIDMDRTISDFDKSSMAIEFSRTELEMEFPQSRIGFFIDMQPIKGAVKAIGILQKHYDVWILSRPSYKNLHCYTEKAAWVRKWLGYEMQTKLILCGNKSLVKGHYLVDDKTTDGQDKFEGELLLFGSERWPDWDPIITYLVAKADNDK